jgi:protein-L-isoaspartate O-methyltransferase
MSHASPQTKNPKSSDPQSVATHAQLVEKLVAAGVLSDRAAAALLAVDRRHFVQTYTGVPDTVAYQVIACWHFHTQAQGTRAPCALTDKGT